jgi:hypothetical protein
MTGDLAGGCKSVVFLVVPPGMRLMLGISQSSVTLAARRRARVEKRTPEHAVGNLTSLHQRTTNRGRVKPFPQHALVRLGGLPSLSYIINLVPVPLFVKSRDCSAQGQSVPRTGNE